jgi:steroid 5-alpha-reductase/3-oxo-5-alpha-steroid 4-dehydrogenase 1
MSEARVFEILLYSFFALAATVFLALQLIVAPYGRHTRAGWGPQISSTAGWLIMEAPASLFFLAVYLFGENRFAAAPLALLLLWQIHYVNRAFVFPFRRRGGDKPIPLAIPLVALLFNLPNAYLNARWLSHFSSYQLSWLWDPRFIAGTALFFFGMGVNWQADRILRELRKPGESGYKVPTGGLYRLVSCPNYLGEIIEWSGWALATWSLPGLMFAVWTAANLVPRARANHKWYRETFRDYPPKRKAVLPGLY